MRPQLLQLSTPFSGQFVSKQAGESQLLHYGLENSNVWQRNIKKSISGPGDDSEHSVRKVVEASESTCLVRHEIPLLIQALNCRSSCSGLHRQKRYLFDSSFGTNPPLITCACRHWIRGVKKKGKTGLHLQTNALDSSSHFALKLSGDLWLRSARELSSFRVQAQSDDSRKSWWDRFLFTPLDINKYPFLAYDFEDSEEKDLENTEEESKDLSDDKDGDDWVKDDIDRMLADDSRFAAWQQRIKALDELREFQKLGRDPDNADWEDWLDDSWGDYSDYISGKDSGWYFSESDWEKGGLPRSPPKLPERGMGRTMKEFFLRIFENEEEVLEDLAFEDRVFRFTSQTTVKFVAVLVAVPWLVSYISHDFVIVPFLTRYVEKVPLAAKFLDLRESQKLQMVETLKLERQRVRFEAAIGKAPPLSDEELLEHIREEALELRDELRLENRKSFGNIWSDILAGITVLLLLVFNPDRVAIMRLTGNRLFTNVSDTGKAFIIILLSDIFLGYHSESGWETVVEIFLEHYGFEADKASIYLFVAIVPVTIDACFKLWVFRFLTRLSPSATATFKEMQRH